MAQIYERKGDGKMGMMMEVALSNRHIHLTEQDFKRLFGEDAKLTVKKQLGKTEFAANETVIVRGSRGEMDHVRILGPYRKETQAELLAADCRQLGIDAPVCESGRLENAGEVTLVGPAGSVTKEHGAIIAQRHVHITMTANETLGFHEGDLVRVKVPGIRGLIFENVIVRLHGGVLNAIHLDIEEGNAAGCKTGDLLEVIP